MKGGSIAVPWAEIARRLLEKEPPERNDHLELKEEMILQYMEHFKGHHRPPALHQVRADFYKAKSEVISHYLKSIQAQTRRMEQEVSLLSTLRESAQNTKRRLEKSIEDNERTIAVLQSEIVEKSNLILRESGLESPMPPSPPTLSKAKSKKKPPEKEKAPPSRAKKTATQPEPVVNVGEAILRRVQSGTSSPLPVPMRPQEPQISKEEKAMNALLEEVDDAQETLDQMKSNLAESKHVVIVYERPTDALGGYKEQAETLIRSQLQLIGKQRERLAELNKMSREIEVPDGDVEEDIQELTPPLSTTSSEDVAPPTPPPPPPPFGSLPPTLPRSSEEKEKPTSQQKLEEPSSTGSTMQEIHALNPMARLRQKSLEEDVEEDEEIERKAKKVERRNEERTTKILQDTKEVQLNADELTQIQEWREQIGKVTHQIEEIDNLVLPDVDELRSARKRNKVYSPSPSPSLSPPDSPRSFSPPNSPRSTTPPLPSKEHRAQVPPLPLERTVPPPPPPRPSTKPSAQPRNETQTTPSLPGDIAPPPPLPGDLAPPPPLPRDELPPPPPPRDVEPPPPEPPPRNVAPPPQPRTDVTKQTPPPQPNVLPSVSRRGRDAPVIVPEAPKSKVEKPVVSKEVKPAPERAKPVMAKKGTQEPDSPSTAAQKKAKDKVKKSNR